MVRNASSAGALLALGLSLAGCAAVGPNYAVPEGALVNMPSAQGDFISARKGVHAAPLPDHWWRLYEDPKLDALVSQALEANTDLKVAEASLERSLALLDERDSSREIDGIFHAESSWAQRSAEAELSHVKPPARSIYNIGSAVSYDLDLFGGLRRGIEAARADTEAAVAARDLARVNVAAETARAYVDLCNAGYQHDVLQRAIGLQERGVELGRILIAHGRAAPYELDRRAGALASSRAKLPRLIARQRNALFRLAALTSKPPAEADLALLQCHQPLELARPIPVGDGSALLKRRPDIRMAERRLAAGTARIGVVTAELYPNIRLGASIGSTGAVGDRFSPLTNRFGIGPMIDWTLNRHAVRARINAAEAQTRGDLAAFDGTVLKALREVETALDAYAASLEQQADLDLAQMAAANVAKHTRQLRRGGRISELPALEAERDLVAAQVAAAEGRATINEQQVALFLALGGGWTSGG